MLYKKIIDMINLLKKAGFTRAKYFLASLGIGLIIIMGTSYILITEGCNPYFSIFISVLCNLVQYLVWSNGFKMFKVSTKDYSLNIVRTKSMYKAIIISIISIFGLLSFSYFSILSHNIWIYIAVLFFGMINSILWSDVYNSFKIKRSTNNVVINN